MPTNNLDNSKREEKRDHTVEVATITIDKSLCNCELWNKPIYSVSQDPHCVSPGWICPIHGSKKSHFLIHTEKYDYCVPCKKGCHDDTPAPLIENGEDCLNCGEKNYRKNTKFCCAGCTLQYSTPIPDKEGWEKGLQEIVYRNWKNGDEVGLFVELKKYIAAITNPQQ